MTELKWLDGYTGQTTDALIALKGEYRIDSLVLAFEEALTQKAEKTGSDKLTQQEQIVLAVEALEREVNNGGYMQFFENSSEFTPVIVDALTRIHCPEAAALTQQAIDALEFDGPITVEAVNSVMQEESDEIEERLEVCDNQYYQIAGDLSIPLLAFIEENKDQIVLT